MPSEFDAATLNTGTDAPLGVSYVVPVFNKSRWLPAVLAALKNQRGDFAREYIFVDDGSTDDSLAVLRALTRDWPDTVVVAQANAGSAAATNPPSRCAERVQPGSSLAPGSVHACAWPA